MVGSHELAESLFKVFPIYSFDCPEFIMQVADTNNDGVICLSEWQKLGLSRTKTQVLKKKKMEEQLKKQVT
jgi:hypothetical protein